MTLEVVYDTSLFIEQAIKAVFGTIWEAILLVALVIFLFLRNLRATIIPLITIPVSLIGAFALMYVFNFSINTLTLLAMVLAIGLVVDDAIVVLENIYRNLESGMTADRGRDQGRKGNRLCGGGDDAHARGRLCAAGFRDGTDRQAVHRIRARLGRCRGGFRVCRPDAFADAVLAHSQARGQARPGLQRDRDSPAASDRCIQAHPTAILHNRLIGVGAVGGVWPARGSACSQPEAGTCARRGPGDHFRHRVGS